MSIEYKDLKHENIILYNRLKKYVQRGYIDEFDKLKPKDEIIKYYTHYQQFIEEFGTVPYIYSYTTGQTIRKIKKEFKDIGQLIKDHIIKEEYRK